MVFRPLIRIIAERYPSPVKAAILSTLTILLSHVPQFVRPFFPQLQRTFVKNLSDISSSTVRNRAASGLGVLMGLQPRIDSLISELVNGASHDEQDVRDAMMSALSAVIASGGNNMGTAARLAVAELVRASLEEASREARNGSIARTIAAMLRHGMSEATPIVVSLLEDKATPLRSVSILECLEIAPKQLYDQVPPTRVVSRILESIVNEHPGIARPAREAKEMLKKTEPWLDDDEVQARCY